MNKYNEFKEIVNQKILEHKSELALLNDYLADHPEIAFEEKETSLKMVTLLRDHDFNVEYPFDGLETAYRATFGNNNHKYKIALLTEYDALPGVGHACGHCLSGSISLLAGIALKSLQDDLNIDVHIIGTPAEETDGAKCKMVSDGIFDQYDYAIMVHLYNRNIVEPVFLALDSYMYEFHGKAAHASTEPWEGINAFNATQLMFHGMDMLRQHVRPDVRIHGIIRDGGEAPNIVPEFVSSEIYIRSLSREYLDAVTKKVDLCAEGAAIATGTTWNKYPKDASYDNLKHNETGVKVLREVFSELDIEENMPDGELFGSADAGNVSFICPTFHPCLQLTPPNVAIHTREFSDYVKTEKAHDCLEVGAKIITYHILKIFSDDEKIAAMKADFKLK